MKSASVRVMLVKILALSQAFPQDRPEAFSYAVRQRHKRGVATFEMP